MSIAYSSMVCLPSLSLSYSFLLQHSMWELIKSHPNIYIALQVSMIYRLYLFQTTHKCPACKKVVGKYSGNGQWAQPFWLNQAKPSLTEGFGGKVQRQWPVSEAILAQMTKPNQTRFVSLFFFITETETLWGGGITYMLSPLKPNQTRSGSYFLLLCDGVGITYISQHNS